jgi:hypothetical protein
VVCLVPIISQLYHAKSTSYFGEVHDKITRLFTITIQTGFLTTILAIPIAPLYISGPEGLNALPYAFHPNMCNITISYHTIQDIYVGEIVRTSRTSYPPALIDLRPSVTSSLSLQTLTRVR